MFAEPAPYIINVGRTMINHWGSLFYFMLAARVVVRGTAGMAALLRMQGCELIMRV